MAKITCAISGITFSVDQFSTGKGVSLHIAHTEGYFHPIFAADHRDLHSLYSAHCLGKLTPTDSYLLFLAFLHSSGKIVWKHPATLDPARPTTRRMIECNIRQLLAVIAKTEAILHPHFSQPEFKVSHTNSDLSQISSYIAAWEDNIEYFNTYRADLREKDELQKVENYLSTLILSGEDTAKHAHVVADWAAIAADFPAHKREEYKRVIRTCFNITKMFNTPIALLKEIKEYCECNIEAGSIHFHTLSKVLKKGISCHIDYLGGSSLALGYTILPTIASSEDLESIVANEIAIKKVIAKAPSKIPVATDYPNKLEFLRAKLAYRVSASAAVAVQAAQTATITGDKI